MTQPTEEELRQEAQRFMQLAEVVMRLNNRSAQNKNDIET